MNLAINMRVKQLCVASVDAANRYNRPCSRFYGFHFHLYSRAVNQQPEGVKNAKQYVMLLFWGVRSHSWDDISQLISRGLGCCAVLAGCLSAFCLTPTFSGREASSGKIRQIPYLSPLQFVKAVCCCLTHFSLLLLVLDLFFKSTLI